MMDLSGLVSIVVVLVIAGAVLYLVERFVPMAEPFRIVIRVVIVIGLCLWLLSRLGLWSGPLFR